MDNKEDGANLTDYEKLKVAYLEPSKEQQAVVWCVKQIYFTT